MTTLIIFLRYSLAIIGAGFIATGVVANLVRGQNK